MSADPPISPLPESSPQRPGEHIAFRKDPSSFFSILSPRPQRLRGESAATLTLRRPFEDLRPRALQLYARHLQAQIAGGRAFDCLITGDAEMRRLNRTFRAHDYPTDVLSFPGFAPHLGDLAISIQRARAQARRFGHGTEEEIRILMLHGLLHLLGLDHENGDGRMQRAERRWRARLGLPCGLIERGQP